MRLRSKAVGIVVLPLLSIGFLAPGASAKVDKGDPYGPTAVPAGGACPFAVVVSGHDATVLTPKPNGGTHSAGYFDFKMTNPANGKSVFRVASGPGDFSPNGTTIYARGDWVDTEIVPGHPARTVFVSGSKFRISTTTGLVYKKAPDVTVENLCKDVA